MPAGSHSRATWIGTGVALLLIAQQIAGKTVRDALFLSNFAPRHLATMMMAAAGVSAVVVWVLSRALTRWGPAKVLPRLLLGNALLFVLEGWLAPRAPAPVAVAVYLHAAALGASIVSGFWSLISESFDPHAARGAVARIGQGASVGGVLGGGVAWVLASEASLEAILMVLGGVSLAAAFGTVAFSSGRPAPRFTSAEGAVGAGGRAPPRPVPYLRVIAAVVLLGAVAEALIEYAFKTTATAEVGRGAPLAQFFALFYTTVGVLTWLTQATLVRRALDRIGLVGTLATLPGLLFTFGIGALVLPGLVLIAALRGVAAAAQNSTFRSAYELLYTPLPPRRKRPVKLLVDVGCEKVGTALGAGLALAVVASTSAATGGVLLVLLAMAMAAAGLSLGRPLHRGYVRTLAIALETGSVQLDEHSLQDATTRQTFTNTIQLDRQELLAQIAAHQRASGSHDELAPDPSAGGPQRDDPGVDSVAVQVAELRSPNVAAAAAAADRLGAPQPELVGHLIPLLADGATAPAAVRALSQAAERAAGQLTDALLDTSLEVRVRRRLPLAMKNAASERIVHGLLLGLRDGSFQIRARCAAALLKVHRQAPTLAIDRDAVLQAVRDELARVPDTHRHEDIDWDADDDGSGEWHQACEGLGSLLTYVFALLATVNDREPLELAFRALGSNDERLRGTGLEYLENVLPAEIRGRLASLTGDAELTKGSIRPRAQLEDELLASREALIVDREALLRRR